LDMGCQGGLQVHEEVLRGGGDGGEEID
jgi:hypothetical protein